LRGNPSEQVEILSTLTPDELVPADHPIRRMNVIVDRAFGELDADFAAVFSHVGQPTIAPERLLKASLLIALYTVRSERQCCERLRYDMLFKWFLETSTTPPSTRPPSARTGSGSSIMGCASFLQRGAG
jgi:transposase